MALSRPWAKFKAGSVAWWINRDFDRPELRSRLVRYMSPYERVWFVAQCSRARRQPTSAREFERLCQAHI